MPAWKVLFISLFGAACLALFLATIVVPISMAPEEPRLLWFAGLLVCSIVFGTLFTMYLVREDKKFKR